STCPQGFAAGPPFPGTLRRRGQELMPAWAPSYPAGEVVMPAQTSAPLHERAIPFFRPPDLLPGDLLCWSLVDLEAECARLTDRIGHRMGFDSIELEDLGRDFYVHLTEQNQRRL